LAVSAQILVALSCGRSDSHSASETQASPTSLVHSLPSAQWFTDVTDARRLDFVHESGAEGNYFTPEITGSGCALFDYDNDGDLDAYLVNGNWDLASAAHDVRPVNQLFRQDADGSFVDVTDASGLGDGGYGMGVAVGDIDNDGDLDVYVTNLGLDRLYRNNGDGTFLDITATARIGVDGWSASAGFFDYNRDVWLVLFVVRFLDFITVKRCFDACGRPDYCAPSQFPALADVLLRNNGDGTFSDVSADAGIRDDPRRGLGLACADFNDDGWIDLYVANDGDPNQLWINRRDGTFHERAVIAGAAFDIHGRPQAGMGVVAVDLDDNLTIDVFVTNFSGETNTLYANRGGDEGFDDHSASSGLIKGCIDHTGFGVEAFDIELDGDLDLAIVNGATLMETPHPRAGQSSPFNRYAEPNLVYLNSGKGDFKQSREQCSAFVDGLEISRGLVGGDIDNDGDIDLLVSNTQGRAQLFRYDAPEGEGLSHWLGVRCIDPQLNRDAIGAKVIAHVGPRRMVRTISAVGSCMSACQPLAHFGLGEFDRVDAVEVRWPDGLAERFGPLPADQTIVLERETGNKR
jgi:hypothetical protein